MKFKDYYKILEVSPSATAADIKKSYRRLALRFHPDKNFGNQLFEAKFQEIKEAYDVLSNAGQRQAYNLTRSHLTQTEKKQAFNPITPHSILAEIIGFRKKISLVDPDRMNKMVLFQQIQQFLSSPNILLLQRHNDATLNSKIVEEIMYCARTLPFAHVEKICIQLTALAGTDNALYRRIYSFSRQVKLRAAWEKYKLLAAILLAIFLCFAIYVLSATI